MKLADIKACPLALLLMGACIGSGHANADDRAPVAPPVGSGQPLSVEAPYRIPVREVSGLALLPRDSPAFTIYAIGDSSFGIGRIALDEPSGQPRIDAVDASRLFGGNADEASQWEAVATDGRGGLCVQAEVSSLVSCFGADLQVLTASFTLDPSGVKGLGKLWNNDPNSRGEGMILMKRGHLLLLKEKRPSLLVEFGPAGEPPIGYGHDTFLDPGEGFVQPTQDRLVALKVWQFSKTLAALAKDASDLTVGPDGRVLPAVRRKRESDSPGKALEARPGGGARQRRLETPGGNRETRGSGNRPGDAPMGRRGQQGEGPPQPVPHDADCVALSVTTGANSR